MLRAVIMVAMLWAGTTARAGAWTQAPGEGLVVASSYPGGPGVPGYGGIYAEFGLTPTLTAGIDAGRAASGSTKSVVFARRALPVPGWTGTPGLILATEIGLGRIARQPVLRPGLSLGHGLDAPIGQGWISVDTLAEIGLRRHTLDFKTDVTFGLRPRPGLKAMVQLQTGQSAGDPPFARVVPSVVMDLRGKMQLELGLTHTLRGPRRNGAKIALWRRF